MGAGIISNDATRSGFIPSCILLSIAICSVTSVTKAWASSTIDPPSMSSMDFVNEGLVLPDGEEFSIFIVGLLAEFMAPLSELIISAILEPIILVKLTISSSPLLEEASMNSSLNSPEGSHHKKDQKHIFVIQIKCPVFLESTICPPLAVAT